MLDWNITREVYVDHGYKGHGVADTSVWIAGATRGVTLAIKSMKSDGRLGRNFLEVEAGDAINALLWVQVTTCARFCASGCFCAPGFGKGYSA